MRFGPPFLIVGLGLALLAAIGVGRLESERRAARLEAAFHLLTVGRERLDVSDAAGARQQFQRSMDQFRALELDPLMALHHAFAASLRLQTESLQEMRELSIPAVRAGDVVLALALSEDSTLLAVATRQRLLCLQIEDKRWAEWNLPQPVKSAAALDVDSASGKLHLVVGDDGKLLTANCREAAAPLVVTESVTGNEAAVAWLDADGLMVWVAPARPAGLDVKITARPLPGAKGKPVEFQVPFPGWPSPLFPRAAVVHSIAKVDDNILLFYGDARLLHRADLRDSSVLVISMDDPEHLTNRMVFAAFTKEDESGKVRWHSTHVRRLLPASAPGRVYALTEGPRGVAVLGSDAKPIELHADSLFSTDHRDGSEVYDLSVSYSGAGAGPVMEVGRRRTADSLRYQLPWRFSAKPALAAISRDGRLVVVANPAGEILLVDVSKAPAH